jgi:hypothetical protein
MRRIALVLLPVLLAACSRGTSAPTAHTEPSQPTSVTPSSVPSPSPASSPAARAVYYLHDDGSGPRLYRELHPRPATTGVIRDAVTTMLSEPAYDPDYTSLWPRATRVLGARVAGATAYVDLSGEARTGSAGGAGEEQSLQQLVWTVTAAAPAVHDVQLLIEGRAPETLWGHVDTRRPLPRGPAAYVLGGVWIALRDGADLRRGSTVGGEASVFEATVSYEWRQGGRVVKRGAVNATAGAPGRGAWRAPVDVPPGRYLLRAFESSAKDGSARQVDDKQVVVTG